MRLWRGIGSGTAGAAWLIGLGLSGCGWLGVAERNPKPPPNLLMITIDTLRWDQVGCYGGPPGLTPHLDRLAADGVRFESAFAQIPLTLPSHASILTGLYPLAHRVRDNIGFVLSRELPTLAEQLQAAGYRTGAFVGAFVLDRRFGLDQGFETYSDRMSETDAAPGSERRGAAVVKDFRDWLGPASARPRPWFAWLHFYDPHAPYDPPPEYRRGSGKRPLYQGELRYTDAALGQALAAAQGAARERALIAVVTADHGESLGDHGEESHCLLVYDATLRVPLVIWASDQRFGRAVRVPGHALLIDLAPTILELAGAAALPAAQGRSLVAALAQGTRLPPRASYAESLYGQLNLGWSELRVLRGPRWKYIRSSEPELYDLVSDPAERVNLAPLRRDEVERREAELLELIRSQTVSSAVAPERAAVDPETRERLASLGYLGGAAPAPQADQELRAPIGPAPAARVADWVRIQAVVELAQAGRCSEADAELEPLQRGGAVPALAYRYLGECYRRSARPARAAEVLEQGLRQGAGDVALLLQLGTAYHEQGKEAEALVQFQRALELDPESVEALNNLGNSYMVLGDWGRARATFERAVAARAGHSSAWNGLGVACFRLGDHQRAIESFGRALELDPEQPDALYNLANVFELVGRRAEAVQSYRRFLALARPGAYAQQIERTQRALVRLSNSAPER